MCVVHTVSGVQFQHTDTGLQQFGTVQVAANDCDSNAQRLTETSLHRKLAICRQRTSPLNLNTAVTSTSRTHHDSTHHQYVTGQTSAT